MLATTAAVAGLAAYGLVTWRRSRWWPPALLGLIGGLLAVAALGGPGPALHHHLLAVRDLTGPHPGGLAGLLGRRWAAWLGAQLPLSVPVGLVAAGLARHRVTHLPAHELSPTAQARRAGEDRARLRHAQKRAAVAPLDAGGRKVLGAWVAGDLTGWRAGEWATIPDGVLGLGTVVVGLPGAGKTETLLRLAEVALAGGVDVHVIDAKGDPATQTRFGLLASGFGVAARLFPQEAYDGWRGDPTALRNRLGRVVDYTEPYYQDGARVAVDHATSRGARNIDQLLAGLADSDLDVDNTVRRGTLSRYRSFSAAVGTRLSGTWAFEDTRASYLLLDGVALGDDTPRLARYLLEDFLHFASARKQPDRKVLLIVDEFSALRVSNAAALLERLRSFGAGVVIAAQSIEGLHDDPSERARLLGAASTVIAHRLADPEPVAARAGTVKRAERSHQLDQVGVTGGGSLRIQETYRIDPNDLRNLPPGVAWITTAGRAAKVAVSGAGPAPVAGSPRRHDRRDRRGRDRGRVGPPEPVPGGAAVVMDGPEEISFVEARLIPSAGMGAEVPQVRPRKQPRATRTPTARAVAPSLPISERAEVAVAPDEPQETTGASGDTGEEFAGSHEAPPRRVSPYAEGL